MNFYFLSLQILLFFFATFCVFVVSGRPRYMIIPIEDDETFSRQIRFDQIQNRMARWDFWFCGSIVLKMSSQILFYFFKTILDNFWLPAFIIIDFVLLSQNTWSFSLRPWCHLWTTPMLNFCCWVFRSSFELVDPYRWRLPK